MSIVMPEFMNSNETVLRSNIGDKQENSLKNRLQQKQLMTSMDTLCLFWQTVKSKESSASAKYKMLVQLSQWQKQQKATAIKPKK